MTVTVGEQWRSALGAKRRGKEGWRISCGRRDPIPWAIDVGFIKWTDCSFWRVGLAVQVQEHLTEVAHLRYDTEAEAFEAVTWIAAAATAGGAEEWWHAERARRLGWTSTVRR